MKRLMVVVSSCAAVLPVLGAPFQFEKPIRLMGGDKPVRVESPGYAAPCWADIDKDGKSDLLVGQFNDGKIHVFKGLGNLKFAPGEYLKADGKVALVPGVW